MDASKPEPPKGVPAGPYPNERLERCSRPEVHEPHRIHGSAMYRSRWCDGLERDPLRPESSPHSVGHVRVIPRIQELGIPGMEAMTDEQLRKKLIVLLRRKAELENQLKGCQTAVDTALQILNERKPEGEDDD